MRETVGAGAPKTPDWSSLLFLFPQSPAAGEGIDVTPGTDIRHPHLHVAQYSNAGPSWIMEAAPSRSSPTYACYHPHDKPAAYCFLFIGRNMDSYV